MCRPRPWAVLNKWILSGFQHFSPHQLHFRQKIERSSLTGTEREVIINTAFHAFGLTIYDQYIYWTDFYTQRIYRANKYDGSDQMAMTTSLPSRPKGISTVVKHQQRQCNNPCDQFNGGCSHICAPGKALLMKIKMYRMIQRSTTKGSEGIFPSNRRKKKPNSSWFQCNL